MKATRAVDNALLNRTTGILECHNAEMSGDRKVQEQGRDEQAGDNFGSGTAGACVKSAISAPLFAVVHDTPDRFRAFDLKWARLTCSNTMAAFQSGPDTSAAALLRSVRTISRVSAAQRLYRKSRSAALSSDPFRIGLVTIEQGHTT